jgi:hypothetical protein
MNCTKCAIKLRVVNTQSFDNITQRWYRCPECDGRLRTCETVHLGGAKRNPKGSAHPNAVLTEDDIVALRREREHSTIDQLAKRFGIHRSTVINILKGRAWGHVAFPSAVAS